MTTAEVFQFTPGAQRALDFAARWGSDSAESPIHLPELLLGLVAEPECRAALLLAPFGIDAGTIRQRWLELKELPSGPARAFSPELETSLRAAMDLLWEYPQPLQLATEHLLLGIAASESEVSTWLAERGVTALQLQADIHRLSGHQPGPIDVAELQGSLPRDRLVTLSSSSEADLAASSLSESSSSAALRILDAAGNRCAEGLRVAEDFVRFVLDDRHLTERLKQIRHRLRELLAAIPFEQRLAARETTGDVGASVTTPAEQSRHSSLDVAAASFQRAQQALRSLEEYGKLISPEWSAQIESLRYEVYQLHKAVFATHSARQRLASAKLYVLLDGGASLAEFRTFAASLVAAGVEVLQLRDKTLCDRELFARAQALREVTRGTDCLFIMNDRPDLAVLADADGVHVGQEELTVAAARRIVGPARLIGLSTHSVEQARAAVLSGADYIGIGPTFPSQTKEFATFSGLELIRSVVNEVTLPAYAIGGINLENLQSVMATGVHGVALSAAITQAAKPVAAVGLFHEAIQCKLD